MEQEAGQNSHPISTINLSFPENRVVPPVCPVPAQSTWWWGWRGRPAFEQGRIPGGVVPRIREAPPVVPPAPAAILEVLSLHNSHELWNVSGHFTA